MREEVTAPSPLEWQAIWDVVEAAASLENGDKPSRNEATYGSIKRMILAGQLGPGRKLVHEEMATALNVSRTPVREALERLYQEGFVTRLPRRGFYVAGITRAEAIELYAAREALEIFALTSTLERGPLPRDSVDLLWHQVRRYEELITLRAVSERILADILFHLKLAELSGNRYIVRLLAQTFERLALKRRLDGYGYDRSKKATLEHTRLVEAIARFDRKQSIQLLRKHIHLARDALLSQLYEASDITFEVA